MDNNQEIAKIAYELYLLRGGEPGDPVSDWVTAERIYAERNGEQTVESFENIETRFVVTESVVSENRVEAVAQVKTRARKSPALKTAPKKEARKADAKASAAKPEKKLVEPAKPKKTSRKKTNGAAE